MFTHSLPRIFALGIQSFAVAALLVGVTGCGDDRDPIPPLDPAAAGREYYPLAIGRFWEYDVEEHHWNFNRDSVVRFQLRERVDTVYEGATGELNYRIVRSLRTDSLAVWRDDSSAAVVLTSDLVHRTFANRPTVELMFPVMEGKSWNPNLFNASDSSSRTYTNVGQAKTLPSGRAFAKTLRVADEANITAVERNESESTYAWNVGKVYRRYMRLDYCNQSDANLGLCMIGTGYIVRGTDRTEQLRNWGPR
jgi:hypothetical protein